MEEPILIQQSFEQLVREELYNLDMNPEAGILGVVKEARVLDLNIGRLLHAKVAGSSVRGVMGSSYAKSAFAKLDEAIDLYLDSVPRASIRGLYCLILVEGHAMAVAYDRISGCVLYDPDTGVYAYDDWTEMLKDLWNFLGQQGRIPAAGKILIKNFVAF